MKIINTAASQNPMIKNLVNLLKNGDSEQENNPKKAPITTNKEVICPAVNFVLSKII